MAEALDGGAEFSRMVDCSSLGSAKQRHRIEADEGERIALANRLGILSLHELKADIDLTRTGDGMVQLKAKFRAQIAQNCIVALQPMHQNVGEEFELFFKEGAELDGVGRLEVTLEDELWPEPLDQGRIDIGEAISQQLALALDPYPRASGAVFEAGAETGDEIKAGKPLADIGKLVSFGPAKDKV